VGPSRVLTRVVLPLVLLGLAAAARADTFTDAINAEVSNEAQRLGDLIGVILTVGVAALGIPALIRGWKEVRKVL